MKIESVNHYNFTVQDLDKSIEFYTKILRMKLLDSSTRDPGFTQKAIGQSGISIRIAYLKGNGFRIELIEYKNPEDFMYLTDARDSLASTVKKVTDPTGITINILNNKQPQYFTSFDDVTMVFDSYLAAVDTTLQSTKTQCHGKRSVAFTVSDSFTPDLPIQMFTFLLAEAKSSAFLTLKQMANQKAEMTSTTQRRKMSQEAWRLHAEKGIMYPNYGRNRATKKTPNY